MSFDQVSLELVGLCGSAREVEVLEKDRKLIQTWRIWKRASRPTCICIASIRSWFGRSHSTYVPFYLFVKPCLISDKDLRFLDEFPTEDG